MAKRTISSTGEEEAAGKYEMYLGDSWFASVDAVIELKKIEIGIIKTNHCRCPKKWIEGTMKNWTPGLHMVMFLQKRTRHLFKLCLCQKLML